MLGTHKINDGSLGKVMTQSGRTYDFKVAKRFFVMTRAWGNMLFFAQSYDRKIGEKYDDLVRYMYHSSFPVY